ncbi:MAG: hypothetical protein ACTSRW_08080 [Candidatus Helarchaeota archaeon]
MMEPCYICNSKTDLICENCERPFCDSCSGITAGVKDAGAYCKKCTLRLFTVRCTKCGNRFKSKDDLEEHFRKHPVHRTQFD